MARRGESNRRERIPFGGRKQKLSLDPETKERLKASGIVERWVNDQDGRLEDAENGGYHFLTADGTELIGDSKETTEAGKKFKKLVGKHEDGRPKYAYLMGIKKKWYEEDQAAKEERNRMVDDAIRGGNTPGVPQHGVDPSKGGTYKKNINLKT